MSDTKNLDSKRKQNYNLIYILLMILLFLQVTWYIIFSPPFFGGKLKELLDNNVISPEGRIIMIYHSLSVPFTTAIAIWLLKFYEGRIKWIRLSLILLIPGAFVVAISGMIFSYTGLQSIHDIFFFGQALAFLGGCFYLISIFNIHLENLNLVVLVSCILISVIFGALAALENFTGIIWGLGRPPNAFLAEYLVRKPSWDIVEKLIIAHLHLIPALLSAAILLIFYRIVKIPIKLYKILLITTIPGIILMSVGAMILYHYLSWVGSGILLICALIVAIIGWKEIIEKRLSNTGKLKALFKDPVNFSKYFLLLFVNITVTIPGIYVGINLELYRSLEFEQLELEFVIGHWHILVVLIATILIFLTIDYFKVEGWPRKTTGWILTLGSLLTFGGTTLFILRQSVFNIYWLYMTVIIIGIWLLFLGFAMGISIVIKKYIEDKREKKKK